MCVYAVVKVDALRKSILVSIVVVVKEWFAKGAVDVVRISVVVLWTPVVLVVAVTVAGAVKTGVVVLAKKIEVGSCVGARVVLVYWCGCDCGGSDEVVWGSTVLVCTPHPPPFPSGPNPHEVQMTVFKDSVAFVVVVNAVFVAL